MKNSPPSHFPRRDHGVALVLVLCFVVLITGLVVAYFSRTLTTRQLANASTSTEQAEMLANSATDVILGDLKQEIATGSSTPTPPPTLPTGVTVYVPTQAAYVVPQRNPSLAATTAQPGGPIPNLVRFSQRLDSTGGANAPLSPAQTSRASAVASSTPSANGRFVSTARWNRHYLIPTTTDPGSTPSLTASTPIAAFTPPDWVFVTAEQGPDVLASPFKDSNGKTVTPTGRYAYAIYDEGGLLDVNHTGYPSVSTLSHVGAKAAPSYADLTQLGMTTANVDNLLGWRHDATLQATGSFPGLQPSTSVADQAYYNLFIGNATSLLQVPPTVYNGKTDQMFLSRQQLIGYFPAAGLDLKYLQYLGTFSRSLNQPSYAPESNRPQVQNPTAGGNDSFGNNGITPNFLTARVINAFATPDTRYDGTPVVIGEPLIKKRFPLNRLAWLTYEGPSFNRTQTDPDMAALLADGITADFLNQGTAANIQTYFGLTWNSSTKWTYVHGSNGGLLGGAILNVSNPLKAPGDVANQNPGREPDFFELLKASINPGSIAKGSISNAIMSDTTSLTRAAQVQSVADLSLDAAILQIGANIIDQFDTDGFPTQINYNLGTATAPVSGIVYGVENLPYISRVRNGLIRLVPAAPGGSADSGATQLTNTGVAALMNYPEIWNPHDWNAANLQQSAGVVAPTNFKIYAVTQQATSVGVWNTAEHFSCDADTDPTKSPGFNSMYGFSFGNKGSAAGGESRTLSELNTRMTFTIDSTSPTSEAMFREPAILYQTGYPAGSNLASNTLVFSNSLLNQITQNANNKAFFSASGGLVSAVNASASSPTTSGIPSVGNAYIGFYIGSHPLRWVDSDPNPEANTVSTQTQYGPVNDVTYYLACNDGSGGTIIYDAKSVTTTGAPNSQLNTGDDAGFGLNGTVGLSGSALDNGLRFYETVDPRSMRWGMMDPWVFSNATSIPPRQGYSWVPDPTQTTIKTTIYPDRQDLNAGTALLYYALTIPPYKTGDWFPSSMGWYYDPNLSSDNAFRLGMLSQNNPNVTENGTVVSPGSLPTGTNTTSGTYYPFYYADPDGVVRRASGGNVPAGTSAPASSTVGLPIAYAKGTLSSGSFSSGGGTARQMDSRPVILNRPFRSVAELGYVYSGTPWKNLDFFLPESGDVAMLDVFCISDSSDANGMTAGQVNLNTRQVPVLQAILAQTSKDVWYDTSATSAIPSAQAQQIAQLLVTRTAVTPASGPNSNTVPQPLQNVSDLVGRWVKSVACSNGGINGQASYDGFATDLANVAAAGDPMHNIQRFGESAVRALSNAGQTRVWNLMFDIVAQTGRFPTQATTLGPTDPFLVEGEQHYWVHVAIDRYTGQILDKQVEVVKE